MSDALTQAGALGYVVLIGALIGLVAAGGMAFFALSKRRVPLTALLLAPYLILGFGAFGAWGSISLIPAQVEAADPGMIPVVAMNGAWQSLAVDWLARWGAAVVLVAGTWAAALASAVVPGSEPKLTLGAALSAAAITVAGGVGVLVYAAKVGGSAYTLGLLVLVGGAGVAFAATRRSGDVDDMFRVAGMRFAASACYVLGIYQAARGVDIGTRMAAFASDSPIMSSTDLGQAIGLYTTTLEPAVTVGVAAMAVAVLVGLCGFFAEIGEVVVRYTVYDAFGVLALMVVVGVLRITENVGFNSLYAVAVNEAAVETYEEIGNALPAAAVVTGEVTSVVRLVEGGFGDILLNHLGHWIVKYRFNGRNWRESETPLEDANLSERPPLLAIEKSEDTKELMTVLQKSKRLFLVLRASEVKAGVFVPPELGRLQVTYLPVKLAEQPDYKSEVWFAAGSPEANWGPTTWFGEKDDSLDPTEYASAVVTSTQAPGVNILVGGRKVNDVVNSCLPYVLDRVPGASEGDPPTLTLNSTRWCALTDEEFEVVREKAAEVWDVPAPTNVTMTVEAEGGLDQAEVDKFVRRELGGLAYCAEQAVKAGETLSGRMTLNLGISNEGQVYDTVPDEKSKVQSPTILRCAGKRFRKLTFTLPPPPTEPAEPAPPPRGGKAAEPPPPPRGIVHLDF